MQTTHLLSQLPPPGLAPMQMTHLLSQLPPPDLDSPWVTRLLSQLLPPQAESSLNELETIHMTICTFVQGTELTS